MRLLHPTGQSPSCNRWLGLLLLTLLGALPVPLAAQDASPWVTTYTSDDLAQAGVTRLSDLFLLLENTAAYSVDGYTWQAALNGLSFADNNTWLLIVDGVPQDYATFGVQNINALPFHVSDVSRITISRVPTQTHGVFAQSGVIHVHTQTPSDGLSLRGSVAAGNEINDPGPFRFFDSTQVNIDRLGPPLYAAFSVAGGVGSITASMASDEHHATDAMLFQRVKKLYQGFRRPQVRLRGPRVTARLDAGQGIHRFTRSRTKLEDLRFFEPLGLEVPNTSVHDHLSGSGVFGDSSRAFSYRVTYDRVHLDTRPNRQDVDFGWLQDRYAVHVASHTQLGTWHSETGATVRATETHTPSILLYDTLYETEGYTTWRWQPNVRSFHSLTGGFSLANNELGYHALATGRQALSRTVALHYTLAQQRMPFETTNSLWFWSRQGYTFLRDQAVDFILPLRFTHPETSTIDVALSVQPSSAVGLTVSVSERRFRGLTAPLYSFVHNQQSDGFTPSIRLTSGLSGRVLGYEATLRVVPTSWMSHQLTYASMSPSSTNKTFVELWDQHPHNQITLTTRCTLPARLRAFMRLHYISSSTWTAYKPADEATSGRFGSTRPNYLLVDVALYKRLWGPRMTALISVRNLFDAPYRPHPAGAALHATLFAQVTLDLTAIRW